VEDCSKSTVELWRNSASDQKTAGEPIDKGWYIHTMEY
jgi:hypothetical protein